VHWDRWTIGWIDRDINKQSANMPFLAEITTRSSADADNALDANEAVPNK